jgi:hypothetical protein
MYLSIPVFDEDEKDYKPPFFIEDSIKEYCKEVHCLIYLLKRKK